jgi:hypothetical protein
MLRAKKMTAREKIEQLLKKYEQENKDLRDRNCRLCKLNKQLVDKFVRYETRRTDLSKKLDEDKTI